MKNMKWAAALLLAMALLLPIAVGDSFDGSPADPNPPTPGGEGHAHSMTYGAYRPPTCTEDGQNAYWYCSGCQKYFEDESGARELFVVGIAANGHSMTHHPAQYETCEAGGMREHWTCGSCQGVFVKDGGNYVSTSYDQLALAQTYHWYEYDYGSVAWAADYTSLAVTIRCRNGCNGSARITVPRGDTWVGTEPTCTTEGVRMHSASTPADFVTRYQPYGLYMHGGFSATTEEPISPSHDWDEGAVTTPAACTEEGVKTYACRRVGCGATRTEPIPAIGHAWGEWRVVAPATTRAEGLERCVCANNAEHIQERPIPRLPATEPAPAPNGNGNGGLPLWLAALALAASSPVLVAIAGK